MATITHHIERLKEKPLHVRERVAIGVSAGVTAVVAVGWLVAMSSSGAFSLATESVVASVRPTDDVVQGVQKSGQTFGSLLGAAGAAFGATTSPASVSVVEVRTSTTLDSNSSASSTRISF